MGVTLRKLDDLRERGALPAQSRVLDIGSSNLYSAEPTGIRSFLGHYDVSAGTAFLDRLAAGSAYGPNGGLNESFIGELLEKAGMTYLAFDVANGYRTQIFDLNKEELPEDQRGSFDTVLNFGTTEHVINQLNAFRVIHDAVKVGGYIVHDIPAIGHIDHGFFCYTPRFFFDLAGYNQYEIVDFSYSMGGPGNDIYNIVRDYSTVFPALARSVSFAYQPPNVSMFLVLRKTKEGPMVLPMETSTSVEVEKPSISKRLMSVVGR